MANTFRLGFATLDHEVVLDSLLVTGEMPTWLTGTLLRNGPAKFEVGNQTYHHWFDGLAMLHQFSFHEGNVSYANKFLQSPAHTKQAETGRISYSEFATDPCMSIFKRMMALFSPEFGHNANVNITRIAHRFIAMTETPMPVEFDPQTLETIGLLAYADDIKGIATTAHPHYDRTSGGAINYITHFGQTSAYNVYRIPAGTTQRQLIASVQVHEPAYMHTFGMTEHYIILTEFPLVVNPLRMVTSGKPFIENYQWKPERGTRFLVLRKQDGALLGSFIGEPFFAFHHVNAFETDDEIVVDLAAFADPQIISDFYLNRLRSPTGGRVARSTLRRYRIPLQGSGVIAEPMLDEQIELPRINYRQVNGRPYRFVYGQGQRKDRPDDWFNQLIKIDVEEHSHRTWFAEGCYPGEPVFVATPGATAEDDGVILSVVLDVLIGRSFLLVLDARSFTERARAEVPHHIPFGFHGNYFGL